MPDLQVPQAPQCLVAYARLVERGREQFAFASPLTWFAVRQYREGRRVGCSINHCDITSPCGRRRHNLVVEPLQVREGGHWKELVVEDKRSTPAEIAATRLDFTAWLQQLDRRKRAAAEVLAGGAATGEAAARLRLSPARVSQLRRELKLDWASFQGELQEISAA